MMFCLKIIVSIHVLIVSLVGLYLWAILNGIIPPAPKELIVEDKWFGEGERVKNEDIQVHPFTIRVEDEVTISH